MNADIQTKAVPQVPAPREPGSVLRIGVLILLTLLTAVGSWLTHRMIADHQQSRFDHEVRRIEYAVTQRMNAYVQVLRGSLGLFEASEVVSRAEWMRYVDTLQLDQRYPGFKALSYLAAVTPQDLDAFVQKVRAEPLPQGMSNPKVLSAFTPGLPHGAPVGTVPVPLHALVLYVAPLNPDNELAIGRDQMREPGRRAALELSIATHNVVLSPRLRMPQVGGSEVGFVAYLPVMRGDQPTGWLTAAFFADRFMEGLLRELPQALDIEIYDGDTLDANTLLYSTHGVDELGGPRPLTQDATAKFHRVSRISLPGRQWSLRFVASAGFVPFSDRLAPWLVALGGLLATLLFYVVERASARWRALAARLSIQTAQLREAEAAIRHRATHDPLTGLANRALFMDRLHTARERSVRRGGSFALAYIDIDNFKPVNDQLGHHVGDELLKAIADRLRSKLRKEDTVARLGGDEFALILEGQLEPPGLAERLCNEIIAALSEPYAIGQNVVRVGASVGLALYPQHGADSEALIVAADSAMYQAKRGGRQRCVVAEVETADRA